MAMLMPRKSKKLINDNQIMETPIIFKIKKKIRRFLDWYAKRKMKEIDNGDLWSLLEEYKKKSNFSGVYYYKYFKLYTIITRKKFKEILECGSGISTVIIAYSLKKNGGGLVTSMEEHAGEYFERLSKIFPNELKEYVDFKSSPKVLDYYGLFCGVRYANVPERVYDFVFIDGPSTSSPVNGQVTFDFDLIFILSRPTIGQIHAFIDNRKSTVWVLKHVLGQDKVSYYNTSNLGYVEAVSKSDLKDIKQLISV